MPGSGNGNEHRSAGSCESCSEAMKTNPVYSEMSGPGAARRVSLVMSHPVYSELDGQLYSMRRTAVDLPGWRTHAAKISTASPETSLVHASPPMYPMVRTAVGRPVYAVLGRPLMSPALVKPEQFHEESRALVTTGEDHEASTGLLKTEDGRAKSKELVTKEEGRAVSAVLVAAEEDHAESKAL